MSRGLITLVGVLRFLFGVDDDDDVDLFGLFSILFLLLLFGQSPSSSLSMLLLLTILSKCSRARLPMMNASIGEESSSNLSVLRRLTRRHMVRDLMQIADG